MPVLGIWAATGSLARSGNPPGFDVQAFYIVPLTDVLIFATLIYFAFRNRSKPAAHKRFIYVATTALLIAAFARWPFAFVNRKVAIATLLSEVFVLFLVAYDLWSTRKIHRATLWAGAFLIFVQQIRIPIAKTAAWHSFAAWVQLHAR